MEPKVPAFPPAGDCASPLETRQLVAVVFWRKRDKDSESRVPLWDKVQGFTAIGSDRDVVACRRDQGFKVWRRPAPRGCVHTGGGSRCARAFWLGAVASLERAKCPTGEGATATVPARGTVPGECARGVCGSRLPCCCLY